MRKKNRYKFFDELNKKKVFDLKVTGILPKRLFFFLRFSNKCIGLYTLLATFPCFGAYSATLLGTLSSKNRRQENLHHQYMLSNLVPFANNERLLNDNHDGVTNDEFPFCYAHGLLLEIHFEILCNRLSFSEIVNASISSSCQLTSLISKNLLIAVNPAFIVEGTITNEFNENLSGVLIRVKNSNMCDLTDDKGHYRIYTNRRHSVVEFSYDGYKTVTTKIDSSAIINLKLLPDLRPSR